jgi:hypothetical protein
LNSMRRAHCKFNIGWLFDGVKRSQTLRHPTNPRITCDMQNDGIDVK